MHDVVPGYCVRFNNDVRTKGHLPCAIPFLGANVGWYGAGSVNPKFHVLTWKRVDGGLQSGVLHEINVVEHLSIGVGFGAGAISGGPDIGGEAFVL